MPTPLDPFTTVAGHSLTPAQLRAFTAAGGAMEPGTKLALCELIHTVATWGVTTLRDRETEIRRELDDGFPAILDELFATMGPALAEIDGLLSQHRLTHPADDTAQQMGRALGAVRQAYDGAVETRRALAGTGGAA